MATNSNAKPILLGVGAVAAIAVVVFVLMSFDSTGDTEGESEDLARLAAIEVAEGFAAGLKAGDVEAANEHATEEFGVGTDTLLRFYKSVQFDTDKITDYDVGSDPLGLVAEGLVAGLDDAVKDGRAYAFIGDALLGEGDEAQYALAIVQEESEWKVASGTVRQAAVVDSDE